MSRTARKSNDLRKTTPLTPEVEAEKLAAEENAAAEKVEAAATPSSDDEEDEANETEEEDSEESADDNADTDEKAEEEDERPHLTTAQDDYQLNFALNLIRGMAIARSY